MSTVLQKPQQIQKKNDDNKLVSEEVFQKYMEQAYEEIKDKDFKQMKESLQIIYENIFNMVANDKIQGWFLVQAPITLIKPNLHTTAFAADDGRVYINPVFINALISYVTDKIIQTYSNIDQRLLINQRDLYQTQWSVYCYIITHEMMHIILKHVWDGKRVVYKTINKILDTIRQSRKNLDKKDMFMIEKVLQHNLFDFANIVMDFLINTLICNIYYSNLLKSNIFDKGIINVDSLYKALHSYKIIDTNKLIERLKDIEKNIEPLNNKTWQELFYIIVDHIDYNALITEAQNYYTAQISIKLPQKNFTNDCSGGCNTDLNDEFEIEVNNAEENRENQSSEGQEGKAKSGKQRKVRDMYDNEYDFNEEELYDVRDGYQEEEKRKKQQEEQKKQWQGAEVEKEKDKQNQNENNQNIRQSHSQQEQLQSEQHYNENYPQNIEKLLADFTKHVKRAGCFKGSNLPRELGDIYKYNVEQNTLSAILLMFFKKVINQFGDNKKQDWIKLNRRGIDELPGYITQDYKKDFIVFVDVSGSITNQELEVFGSSIYRIYKQSGAKNLIIHTFDVGIVDTFVVKNKNDFAKVKFKQGGGTELLPALQDKKVKFKPNDIVVIFTDSELFDNEVKLKNEVKQIYNKIGHPIIWMNYNNYTSAVYKWADVLQHTILPVNIDFNQEKIKFVKLQNLNTNKNINIKISR